MRRLVTALLPSNTRVRRLTTVVVAIPRRLALVLALVAMAVLNRNIDALDAAVAAWRAGAPAARRRQWGRASAAGGRDGDGSGTFDAGEGGRC